MSVPHELRGNFDGRKIGWAIHIDGQSRRQHVRVAVLLLNLKR
jgi:hypothetical protein